MLFYRPIALLYCAAKAHISVGNIYHYFPNKEAILRELLTPTVRNLETLMQNHIHGGFQPRTAEEVREYVSFEIPEAEFAAGDTARDASALLGHQQAALGERQKDTDGKGSEAKRMKRIAKRWPRQYNKTRYKGNAPDAAGGRRNYDGTDF